MIYFDIAPYQYLIGYVAHQCSLFDLIAIEYSSWSILHHIYLLMLYKMYLFCG